MGLSEVSVGLSEVSVEIPGVSVEIPEVSVEVPEVSVEIPVFFSLDEHEPTKRSVALTRMEAALFLIIITRIL